MRRRLGRRSATGLALLPLLVAASAALHFGRLSRGLPAAHVATEEAGPSEQRAELPDAGPEAAADAALQPEGPQVELPEPEPPALALESAARPLRADGGETPEGPEEQMDEETEELEGGRRQPFEAVREARAKDASLLTQVLGAALRGTAAAGVASLLSAFTEPVAAKVLETGCTLKEAVHLVKVKDCLAILWRLFPSNLQRFPAFEVILELFAFVTSSGFWQGVCSGWLFCTVMTPIQNFRFRQRASLPIDPRVLWQGYAPTMLRDVTYGCFRGASFRVLSRWLLSSSSSAVLLALAIGFSVWLACALSSPLNEWRLYRLQPPDKRVSLRQFFNQERFIHNALMSAAIMAASLTVGSLVASVVLATVCAAISHKALVLLLIALAALGALKPRWQLSGLVSFGG